jgi:hypothetical protein
VAGTFPTFNARFYVALLFGQRVPAPPSLDLRQRVTGTAATRWDSARTKPLTAQLPREVPLRVVLLIERRPESLDEVLLSLQRSLSRRIVFDRAAGGEWPPVL